MINIEIEKKFKHLLEYSSSLLMLKLQKLHHLHSWIRMRDGSLYNEIFEEERKLIQQQNMEFQKALEMDRQKEKEMEIEIESGMKMEIESGMKMEIESGIKIKIDKKEEKEKEKEKEKEDEIDEKKRRQEMRMKRLKFFDNT